MLPAIERVLLRTTGAARLRRRLGGRDRVAFVLSGGGNLGPVQVGMLRALTEAGIRPDLIVGCSVGAINGAGYAADPTIGGVERLDRLWRRIADGNPDLMPSRFMPLLAQMARKGEALHDQDRLADLLDDELPTKTFAGLEVPFSCVATDLETASEYWFDHGRLVPALLASAALPAVYPAFEHRGRSFIDGGVLNEIHTAQAVAMGATELYVLHVGHLEGRDRDVQRPFDSAVRAYWTARRFRLEEDLRRVPAHCKVHRLPAGSNPRLRFDDFSQAAELANLAYDATADYLRTGLLPEPVSGPVSDPADYHDGAQTNRSDRPDNGADRGPADGPAASAAEADEPASGAPAPTGDSNGHSNSDAKGHQPSDGTRSPTMGRIGRSVENRPWDHGAERFSRAFSRWGSSSVGQADHPPGWDEPDQDQPATQ